MSTFSNNNVQQLIVGGTAAQSGATKLAAANKGEIVVIDAHGGAILDEAAAATATKFKIGVNTAAGVHVISDTIEKSKVTSAGAKLYAPATEQISYIGYNGTTGSIPVNDNELYYVRLYMEDLYNRSSGDGKRVKHGVYQSRVSATQEIISLELAKSLIANFSREAEQQVAFEQVCDEAGAAIAGAATFDVTNGSKIVAVDAAVTSLVAGDYLKLGGAATTNPVYKVAEIIGTSAVKLETAYQGATATITAANARRITSAQAVAAEFGLKLSGIPADFNVGKITYKKVRFEPQVDTSEGFGDGTLITLAQAASGGTGTVERVAELEWFTVGNEGEFFRMGEPLIFPSRSLVDPNVAGGGYDLININFMDDSVVGFQANVSPKVVTLAIPTTSPAYVTGADDITDVLEVLIYGSTNGALAV